MHQRAHDEKQIEKRPGLITMRGLRVHSRRLNVTGICDVVEFRQQEDGISLPGYEGHWQPYPVEYKRGRPKTHDADELQLCAQAMCLEEMLLCSVPEGSLYYGEPRRRTGVAFSTDMRQRVETLLAEMHQHMQRGYTPRPRQTKSCQACSLRDLCLPGLGKAPSVSDYIGQHIKEADE